MKKRPHLEAFLNGVAAWYDIAVWSLGDDAYVQKVALFIFPATMPLRFLWGRTRCSSRYDAELREHYFLKDLKKVKRQQYDLKRVLIIDDSPEMVARNYGNHLRLSRFAGARDDRELFDVVPFLERLKEQPDFRAIEKRRWKTLEL